MGFFEHGCETTQYLPVHSALDKLWILPILYNRGQNDLLHLSQVPVEKVNKNKKAICYYQNSLSLLSKWTKNINYNPVFAATYNQNFWTGFWCKRKIQSLIKQLFNIHNGNFTGFRRTGSCRQGKTLCSSPLLWRATISVQAFSSYLPP